MGACCLKAVTKTVSGQNNGINIDTSTSPISSLQNSSSNQLDHSLNQSQQSTASAISNDGHIQHNRSTIHIGALPNFLRRLRFKSSRSNKMVSLQKYAERLVLETLDSIRPSVVQEPSNAMHKLQIISSNETGWIVVICSLINVVCDDNPFGTALILLSIEEASLASQETILLLQEKITLFKYRSTIKRRNVSIVLGGLAEKLAGILSSVLFTPTICNYLLASIQPQNEPIVILHSLIALEKFSQTKDNKTIIDNKLKAMGSKNTLLILEKYYDSSEFIKHQVGFCAKYCLDNYFICDGRPYSFEHIDKSNLHAILNPKDASENLKISADCLSCRNDTTKFESFRSNVPVNKGIYYYEAKLITDGVMQIGFATKSSKFLNHEGYGVGDDDESLAFDGCRSMYWYNAKSIPSHLPKWNPGDIVGCLLNLNDFQVQFSVNGLMYDQISELFKGKKPGTQYYAAASLMPFQHLSVNFGTSPFKYPPKHCDFRTFNQEGKPLDSNQLVIPKHLLIQTNDSYEIQSDMCTICCDQKMDTQLEPCSHDGFCKVCADKLSLCPYCRTQVTTYRQTTNA